MRIFAMLRRAIALPVLSTLLVACGSGTDSLTGNLSDFKLPDALEQMSTARQIDRDALFAEIILQFPCIGPFH